MKILILGGTKFLGRHLVVAAQEKGHDVTLFNRGETNPNLFQDIKKLKGDRDGHLDALRGQKWDVVIDTSGYVPRVVSQTASLLENAVDHYIFISSISVYKDFSYVNMDEEAPVGKLEDENVEDVQQYYGQLKALCEKEVLSIFGQRALVVRPGLIVGPYDSSDRFTYWVHRFSMGGDVLIPGKPNRHIQFIDARDLSEWIIRMAEQRVSGTMNATGPETALAMVDFVQELVRTIPNAGHPVWVEDRFLSSKQIDEFIELPLWISEHTGWPGFLDVNIDRAIQHGLTYRPLRETIVDTLNWNQQRNPNELLAGLTLEKERQLLSEWQTWSQRK